MIGFSCFWEQPVRLDRAYLKRPQAILYLLWVAVFAAWFIHDGQWLFGICVGGLSVLPLFERGEQKHRSWGQYVRDPVALASALLLLSLLVWFAWTTGGWMPISCGIATLFLAEPNLKTRRSLRENLKRRSFAVRIVFALVAALWARAYPSFGNVAGAVGVLVLLSADIYLHTSSQKEPLALSHPQS
jgi:hypothetical protein